MRNVPRGGGVFDVNDESEYAEKEDGPNDFHNQKDIMAEKGVDPKPDDACTSERGRMGQGRQTRLAPDPPKL